MSAAVLDRLRDLFLTPDALAPATQVAERAVPATVAALAAREDAAVAGAALGLAAASALRAPCAVVCVWAGDGAAGPRAGVAVPGARRLRDRMASRGLSAAACGRLVTVALPAAGSEARAAAERALAAAGDAPVVIVLGGARPSALDAVLPGVDRVVLVPPADALPHLEDLAVAAAAHLGRSTAVLRLPPATSAAARALATSGLGLPPSLRRAAAASLGGDHA